MAKKSKKRKKKPIRLAQIGRFSYLSSHAIERLEERTQMTPDEMNHLLDHNGYFKLGSHAGFHRVHLLFYSPKDENFFVAIQDERMGKVVTILPVNYHNKLAWRISQDDCDQAKQKFDIYYQASQNTPPPAKETPKPTSATVVVKPPKLARFVYRLCHESDEPSRLEFVNKEGSLKKPKFIITILYIDKDLRIKRKKLFQIHAEDYQHEVKKLWQDNNVLEKIDETVARRNIQQQSIFLLEVLNRQKSLLDYIQFREQEEAYYYMQGYLGRLEIMYEFLNTLDFNIYHRVFLPKYPSYPALGYVMQKSLVNKKSPSKKQIAWAIFVAILLALLYKVLKNKIKKLFSLR